MKRKPGQRNIDPAARRLEFADWPGADRLASARPGRIGVTMQPGRTDSVLDFSDTRLN